MFENARDIWSFTAPVESCAFPVCKYCTNCFYHILSCIRVSFHFPARVLACRVYRILELLQVLSLDAFQQSHETTIREFSFELHIFYSFRLQTSWKNITNYIAYRVFKEHFLLTTQFSGLSAVYSIFDSWSCDISIISFIFLVKKRVEVHTEGLLRFS